MIDMEAMGWTKGISEDVEGQSVPIWLMVTSEGGRQKRIILDATLAEQMTDAALKAETEEARRI